ncbi:MAG: MBOAT family protein, partial [Clostridia bacterium]|nr:MBOAT family protein [Clostridia bacterium]
MLIMIFSTIVDYTVGRLIEWERSRNKNPKIYLVLSMVVNLSLLGIFKYGDFAITNINSLIGGTIPLMGLSLPIGISFYTFQTMSYSIDVYRGRVEAQKSFADLLLYTTLFPQLVAGPIVRYSTIAEQINDRTVTLSSFSDGFCKFVCGLSKKILIANSLASVADYVFGQSVADTAVATAWLGIIAYTFQIYFDFSGYSDMAIGLGKMFG